MSQKIWFWSLCISMGGLLFGLDCAVISGAEMTIQNLWQLSPQMHGRAISSALMGTIVGAAFGNIPSNRLGRKKTLFLVGILFFVTSIGAALAWNVYVFILFRFLGGIAIGASSVVAPVYISEIAPAKHRGKMVMAFQINIVAGILLAYLTNYLIDLYITQAGWRWMLGIVALPSLLFSVGLIFVPESPRWLILYQHNSDAAKKILACIEDNVEQAIENIKKSVQNNMSHTKFFQKKYFTPIFLSFLIAFFNQVSGINAVIYYAPRIFQMTGLGSSSALLSTIGIGVVNFISTILGWYLIDRYGRRFLMYIGSFGYIISLGMITYCFYNQQFTLVPTFIYIFILSHAIGQGAVIWVFIAEIFPNEIRSQGMSWGCMVHWIFATLISDQFTNITHHFGATSIFGFFAFMMILQLLFVWKLMPETKGVSLEKTAYH
ncbi:MAG: sugar porter family MFS transporter [Alphaproteobacteria bacterium]|nr:sugar porter family MFS transporter [Alphaproteobacteria bacterium]